MRRSPAKLADLERTIDVVRELGRGNPVEIDGVPVQITWTEGGFPIYAAAYGPNALRLTGRKGDGVIFQIADPFFVEWAMQFVREGAEEAGRDPAEIVVHCAILSYVADDLDEAREQCRWYPAMVGNHIADVLRYHAPAEIPPELRDYVESRPDYDYRVHAEQGTEHSHYVPDEIIDRFCVIGDAEATIAEARASALARRRRDQPVPARRRVRVRDRDLRARHRARPARGRVGQNSARPCRGRISSGPRRDVSAQAAAARPARGTGGSAARQPVVRLRRSRVEAPSPRRPDRCSGWAPPSG